MAYEGYQAEYAKSGRSKCKGCSDFISEGALRLATLTRSPFVRTFDMPGTRVQSPNESYFVVVVVVVVGAHSFFIAV